MERIVALVEGHLEAHFINSTYANAIVQRPFPNGRDVPIELIVEAINDALETIGGGITRIVILLDREKREIDAGQIRTDLMKGISKNIGSRHIYIGVSDRHIENWILADEIYIAEKFDRPDFRYDGDGTFGKKALEDLCGDVMRGPRDKALLLKAISAIRAGQSSPSLNSFLAKIDFDWAWASS